MPLRQRQELCELSARGIHVVSITQQLHVMGFSFEVMPRDLLRGTIEEYTYVGWKMTTEVDFSRIERQGSEGLTRKGFLRVMVGQFRLDTLLYAR